MARLNKLLWPLVALWLIFGAHMWSNNVLAELSGEKTDDAKITTGYGYFRGIMLITDGSNSVTVDIYDNTSATGRKLIPTWTVTTSSTNRAQALAFDKEELYYYSGIYVDVTTSGTVTYMIYYDPKKSE